MVTVSLDAMASGGMYDHIGGGFARYSVDRQWLVPHFEKMLYDQALLVRVYAHAATALDHPQPAQRWRQVVTETVEYVLRDLRQPGGGIASAEDADSPGPDGHGHEGLFHTWTVDEVRAVLDADADAALDFYGITADGNFEGRSIPNRLHARGRFERPPAIEAARQRLLAARSARPRPGLDDKVLTEWNALWVAALTEAGWLLGRPDWIAAAAETADFLVRELRRADGRWLRSWHADGEPAARHDALAADHACLVDAFVRLGEATGEARWIAEARSVADVDARPLLGRRPRRSVHHSRRRRSARRPAEGADRQRHPGGELDRRGRALPARGVDGRRRATPTTPIASCSSSRRSSSRRRRRSPSPSPRPSSAGRASPRSPSPVSGPISSRSSPNAGGPMWSWRGVSVTTHRCGTAASTGGPTSAATTPARPRRTRPEGLRAQLP